MQLRQHPQERDVITAKVPNPRPPASCRKREHDSPDTAAPKAINAASAKRQWRISTALAGFVAGAKLALLPVGNQALVDCEDLTRRASLARAGWHCRSGNSSDGTRAIAPCSGCGRRLVFFSILGVATYSIATLPLNGGLVDPTPSALVIEASSGTDLCHPRRVQGYKACPPLLRPQWYRPERYCPAALAKTGRLAEPAEGASTITQQLVRLMFLSPEQTMRRKMAGGTPVPLAGAPKQRKEEIFFSLPETPPTSAPVPTALMRRPGAISARRRRSCRLVSFAMLAGLVRAHPGVGGAEERADTVLQAMGGNGRGPPGAAGGRCLKPAYAARNATRL